LLKRLLLTGCRRTELAELWSEIGADGTWVIPGSRTKNRRAHVVPLPPLAHKILASIKPIASVAGNYNKSQLMPERKAALERWAAHIGRLISGEPAKLRMVQK
jgi:integrase